MSKNIIAVQSSIAIDKEDFNDAFKALQSALTTENTRRTGSENRLLWIDIKLIEQASNLIELLETVQWIPSLNELGDIDGVDTRINKIGEEDLIFNALAPFVEDGSILNIIAEDDDLEYDGFRYIFRDSRFINTNRWRSTKDTKPETDAQVLVCFDSHFGEAFSVGSYEKSTDEWYVVNDADGTMGNVEIEPEFWTKIDSPKSGEKMKKLPFTFLMDESGN